MIPDYSLGSTVDDGVDLVLLALELYEFWVGLKLSSRPISRSSVVLNSLETS